MSSTSLYYGNSPARDSEPKPKKMTKREQVVMALREKLPDITEGQKMWMMSVPFADEHVAYYWKRGQVWCQECGHVEPKAALESELIINLGVQKYVCPHCGKTLTLKPYDYGWKGWRKVVKDCTVAVAFGDYTVFRTYQAVRRNSLGADTSMELHEIYQNWVFPDGRMVILSRDYSWGMFTGPSWNHYSDFKPKKYHSWSNTFEVRYNYFAPGWKVSRLARRNGWRAALRNDDVCPIRQLQNLMHPIGEMLVKNKQYRLFNHWTRRGANDMDAYLPSLRICNRNRYVISDASMWLDYIDLLVYFHKDVHNAHYVCPADLKTEHDRLMMKKQRIEEEEAKRDAVKKAKDKEPAYRKLHGAYFGVCFGNDKIVVSVISSVKEMAIEGLLMHHCVYQNGYYERPDSLILSAKDTNGNRLETIEVNLRTWSIVQSRGKFNNPTDLHAEIIDLVNKNMNNLRKFA